MAQSEIISSSRNRQGMSLVEFRRKLLQQSHGEQPPAESQNNETPEEQKARIFAQSISAQVVANMFRRRNRIFGPQG